MRIFILILVSILVHFPTYAAKQKNLPEASKKQKNLQAEALQVSKPYFLEGPKGWECIDDKNQLPAKVELVFIGAGKGQFTPSLNLASEKTTLNASDYTAQAKKYHESQAQTKCQLLGTLDTKAGMAQILQIDRMSQWGEVRFLQATLVKEETAYVITATALHKEFSNHYSEFLEAIRSFTINN